MRLIAGRERTYHFIDRAHGQERRTATRSG
jgi:hypothetical protein